MCSAFDDPTTYDEHQQEVTMFAETNAPAPTEFDTVIANLSVHDTHAPWECDSCFAIHGCVIEPSIGECEICWLATK